MSGLPGHDGQNGGDPAFGMSILSGSQTRKCFSDMECTASKYFVCFVVADVFLLSLFSLTCDEGAGAGKMKERDERERG